MSEINTILGEINQAFTSLNDDEASLATILSERRINSGDEGAQKIMYDMTNKLEPDQKSPAVGLLAGLIGRKKLIEDTKRRR